MTSAWRCWATQPGSPSSNPIRRCGYVAAKRSSENPRGSSVRVASSATHSPTAGASISSAAARAISRSTWSRSSDEAMTPDSRARPWSRASRRSDAAFSWRSRASSVADPSRLNRLTGWDRSEHPCRASEMLALTLRGVLARPPASRAAIGAARVHQAAARGVRAAARDRLGRRGHAAGELRDGRGRRGHHGPPTPSSAVRRRPRDSSGSVTPGAPCQPDTPPGSGRRR